MPLDSYQTLRRMGHIICHYKLGLWVLKDILVKPQTRKAPNLPAMADYLICTRLAKISWNPSKAQITGGGDEDVKKYGLTSPACLMYLLGWPSGEPKDGGGSRERSEECSEWA